jgi:hypothetical protein
MRQSSFNISEMFRIMKMSLYLIYEKKRSKIFKPKNYETEHQESFFDPTGAGSL